MFHPLAPGCPFFLPHGTRIYNKLIEYIRERYVVHGYEEVGTPNILDHELWKTSGHWAHYREHMFNWEQDGCTMACKSMNCPCHCLIFANRHRSIRELPMRVADFGVLHRNELSGALTGLTRVRRFVQDDAHIFCTAAQVKKEVAGVLAFIEEVYNVFGFTFSLGLSTRPAKAIGSQELWDFAESELRTCLEEYGRPYVVNEGDGAFYGPKIDITLRDALGREHQCATCQLDFNMPMRFELEYSRFDAEQGTNVTETPVMVHRAILGSVERFMAILIESFAGKWPLWLSPRQAIVVPVSAKFGDYAEDVRAELKAAGLFVEVDHSGDTLQKKIRNAQVAQFNYILVVGSEEAEARSVNVRTRDNEVHGQKALVDLTAELKQLCASRAL
eukprot:gnl/Ergobibamus_cyprinoides/847.p1 GENE.gnl/Ergobibamus_cyprinoides/847~~gnl/Ergobibamus_cyprinoides/847.p1  ORF type:complete len:404 (-),score=221.91 gnl/Ergobibamus_cyprinoides/847:730-1893(-)